MVNRSYESTRSAARAEENCKAWEAQRLPYSGWRDQSRVLETGWRRFTRSYSDLVHRQNRNNVRPIVLLRRRNDVNELYVT